MLGEIRDDIEVKAVAVSWRSLTSSRAFIYLNKFPSGGCWSGMLWGLPRMVIGLSVSSALPVSGLLGTVQAFLTLCRFLEFEAEEEMQIQNTQPTSGPQGLLPAAPLKLEPPGLVAPELSQQPGEAPHLQQGPWTKGSEGVCTEQACIGGGGALASALRLHTGHACTAGWVSGSLRPKL